MEPRLAEIESRLLALEPGFYRSSRDICDLPSLAAEIESSFSDCKRAVTDKDPIRFFSAAAKNIYLRTLQRQRAEGKLQSVPRPTIAQVDEAFVDACKDAGNQFGSLFDELFKKPCGRHVPCVQLTKDENHFAFFVQVNKKIYVADPTIRQYLSPGSRMTWEARSALARDIENHGYLTARELPAYFPKLPGLYLEQLQSCGP